MAYFSEYTFSILDSSEECLGHATSMSFLSVWCIAQMACIFCFALASAALLRVGRLGGFSSLSFPGVVVTVGFCPSAYFIKFPPLYRPIQQLPCARTLHKFPCRYSAQNTNFLGRIAWPIHWALHGG